MLEEKDILAAIRAYLKDKLDIDPTDVCSYNLIKFDSDHTTRKDYIRVVMREETTDG
jgi:hypothetical protein